MSSWQQPGTPSRARTVLMLVITLGVVPAAAWLFGVAVLQCLLVSAVALLVGLAVRFRPHGEEPVWSPEPVELARDGGARRDVARLSWSVGDDQVGRALRIRLRTLAVRRLAAAGVDLDDPDQQADAERLLGPDAVRVLDLDLSSAVPARAFERAVAALEALDSRPGTDFRTDPSSPDRSSPDRFSPDRFSRDRASTDRASTDPRSRDGVSEGVG